MHSVYAQRIVRAKVTDSGNKVSAKRLIGVNVMTALDLMEWDVSLAPQAIRVGATFGHCSPVMPKDPVKATHACTASPWVTGEAVAVSRMKLGTMRT